MYIWLDTTKLLDHTLTDTLAEINYGNCIVPWLWHRPNRDGQTKGSGHLQNSRFCGVFLVCRLSLFKRCPRKHNHWTNNRFMGVHGSLAMIDRACCIGASICSAVQVGTWAWWELDHVEIKESGMALNYVYFKNCTLPTWKREGTRMDYELNILLRNLG